MMRLNHARAYERARDLTPLRLGEWRDSTHPYERAPFHTKIGFTA